MLGSIDNFLNKITIYRLVLYYLTVLVAAGLVFSFFGLVPFQPANLLVSCVILTGLCYGFNMLLAKYFGAQTNVESTYITAFILTLIITPPAFTIPGIAFLFFASLFSMASKYVVTWGMKHVFNPAAIAVVLTAFIFGWYASWWVGGNNYLLPFVLIGGLLVVRKLQRFDLVLTFIVAALVSIYFTGFGSDPLLSIQKSLLHTTLFFFAFVMLTEPSTTPPTRYWRMLYGAFVGLLFSPAIHMVSISSTPELALVLGNIFSFAVSPKAKALLVLKQKQEIARGIWEFIFSKPANLTFLPGQYMEWTLAHQKSDARGNRRYFTVASSPTESDVRVGVRMEEGVYTSTFKQHLHELHPGLTIGAGQLAGDFTLPNDSSQKLAFIAGGIGITPMRGFLKYLTDTDEKRDIVLLYSSKTRDEVAYADILEEARAKIAAKIVYVITDEPSLQPETNVYVGRIDADMIRRQIPDFAERIFYISGTHAMTDVLKASLREMGVHRSHIKVDFFPGFA